MGERDKAAVQIKKQDKVAIVGWATPSRNLTPFDDESFDIWGCNGMGEKLEKQRFDVWFDMHQPNHPDPNFMKRLDWYASAEKSKPVFMPTIIKKVPNSVRYPIEDALGIFGREVGTSAVSYMIGMAVILRYKAIHLYGIDLKLGSEWDYQRPGTKYMIGFARGVGIEVYVAPGSAIDHVPFLYGYETPPADEGIITEQDLVDIRAQLASQENRARLSAQTLSGAKDQTNVLLETLRSKKREIGIPVLSEA